VTARARTTGPADRRQLRHVEQRQQIAADHLRARVASACHDFRENTLGTSSAVLIELRRVDAVPNRFITSGRSATTGRMKGATST
jgi:hypothetical protein